MQTWIPLTKKDSPYYNKDYNSLSPSEKITHDLYVQGKVSYLNPKIYADFQEEFFHEMERIKREHIIKQHNSEEDAKKIVLNC